MFMYAICSTQQAQVYYYPPPKDSKKFTLNDMILTKNKRIKRIITVYSYIRIKIMSNINQSYFIVVGFHFSLFLFSFK